MVLFKITKDVVPTSLDYVITKNQTYGGSASVQIGTAVMDVPMINVKVTTVDKSDVYAKIRIEGVYMVPQAFILRAIEAGGYIQDQQGRQYPLTAYRIGDLALQLPLGGYYVSATITIQAPQTFDLFV